MPHRCRTPRTSLPLAMEEFAPDAVTENAIRDRLTAIEGPEFDEEDGGELSVD